MASRARQRARRLLQDSRAGTAWWPASPAAAPRLRGGWSGSTRITYIGNHGLERLAPGQSAPEVDPAIQPAGRARAAFAADTCSSRACERRGVTLEDKDAIWVFHWRGAADEDGGSRGARAGRRGRAGAGPGPALGAQGARDPADRTPSTRAPRSPPRSPAADCRARSSSATTRPTSTPSGALHGAAAEGVLEHAVCVGVRRRRALRRSSTRRTWWWTARTALRSCSRAGRA